MLKEKPSVEMFFSACNCVVDLFIMEIAIVNRAIDNVYFIAQAYTWYWKYIGNKGYKM